jgi:hypothetical protein
MPTLSDPTLTITVDTEDNATVTASVDVSFVNTSHLQVLNR